MKKLVPFIVLILLFIFVSGCFKKVQTASPMKAFDNFVITLKERNFEKAWNSLSEEQKKVIESKEKFTSDITGELDNKERAIEILSAKAVSEEIDKSGIYATVTFTYTQAGPEGKVITDTISFVKENGVWKINF